MLKPNVRRKNHSEYLFYLANNQNTFMKINRNDCNNLCQVGVMMDKVYSYWSKIDL